MLSKNEMLKEIREPQARKAESERKFKALKLHTTNELKRKGKIGKMDDDQNTLCNIMFQYLSKIKMSLPYGKNTQECCYWWRHRAITANAILEAFENYL